LAPPGLGTPRLWVVLAISLFFFFRFPWRVRWLVYGLPVTHTNTGNPRMSIKQRFRPTVENLENRRLMAADAGELVAEVDQQEAALLLPAVQAARESTENDTHTYTTGGIFEVIVTVTDDDTGQTTTEDIDEYFAELGDDTADQNHTNWIELDSVNQPVWR
jgi:hypothetical protein